MSGYGLLHVGDVSIRMTEGVGTDLLAVFRDDMLCRRSITERDYELYNSDSDELVEVWEYRAPGQRIADRLEALFIHSGPTLEILQDEITQHRAFLVGHRQQGISGTAEELLLLESFTALDWVEALRTSVPSERSPLVPGTQRWLLHFLDYWDTRYALRACLLAFPDAEVVLDVTELQEAGWVEKADSLASQSLATLHAIAESHAPIVVLTEGRTDAEFLSAALRILYPHLEDLIRFLDFSENKNEGGAGALVKTVKAFAAAGIANRVVAIFDNDAAAAAALRALESSPLPSNIKVLKYPDIDLARQYPTLGPPTHDSPTGSITLADVNGLAGSIEIYLGPDVLSRSPDSFYPVQWRSYVNGPNAYQGEVVEKIKVQEAFRNKVALATHGSPIVPDDWADLQKILEAILTAFTD